MTAKTRVLGKHITNTKLSNDNWSNTMKLQHLAGQQDVKQQLLPKCRVKWYGQQESVTTITTENELVQVAIKSVHAQKVITHHLDFKD